MSSQRNTINLKRITRRSAFGILGIAVPSAIWATGIEPNLLSITRKELTLPHWPQALDGFRVAQLTDLHFRPGYDDALIAKACKKLADEKPDLITLTGDFVIRDPSSLPELFRALKGISAQHGVIASPGNHDRWHCSTSQLRKEIEGAGFTYLQNQGSKIHIKGENIFINGLDSIWAGRPDPRKAWQSRLKGEPVIALVHEPDPFAELHLSQPLDLQLSGHTHGGQCRVPFTHYSPAQVNFGRKFIYGHFEMNRSQLFVSRGLGTVGPRVRFACSPELAILTLRSSR